MQKKLVLAATLMVFGWVNAQTAANDSIELSRDLEEIVVSSTRMGGKTSQTAETFTADKLEERNIGVNLPYLLSGTPSLIVTSDDGLGVGYTYFRIRGTDQNRINMTINGVPLNNSESQTVFWVNMTDLAASMNSVNVQRGVGSSTNGASAFGASVNMQTAKTTKNPYAQIDFNGGMYNTFRESVKFGTGLMKNGFSFDARFSKVNSDGYVERAFSDLYSYYASGAWYGMNTMVKLMAFGGGEKTYMAWDGIDSTTLADNRRYNPAGHYIDDDGNDAFYDNQTDNYRQNHFQLHASHIFNARWNLNAALHYTYGNGYYEQYKENRKFAEYGLPNLAAPQSTCSGV
ncbi:MAG TPA: TonB-dependent receptor plug domain-containing protein, partial [Paludibacteraceae bacterium]|nr:TonB-dependent receptor plug domain-containing protein [Paludibacteraceae bacterium]